MTTRDPRARPPGTEPSVDGVLDPTQSLQLDLEAEAEIEGSEEPPDPHPSLAVGTRGDDHTKVASPGARNHPSARHELPPGGPPPVPRHAPDPELRIGEVLGSYRLVALLGKGGMGYVYRAEHTKLGREVALKLLRADYSRRRDAVSRFFQEAKTVNRVRHRNIVDVTDFVELGDGTTFIIMELLRGTSLGKWARSGVDLPRAIAVLVQICDGLGAAHAVGVIHRDLKPDNVIVVPMSDGAELVKLLDFGVAKLVHRDDEDVGFQTAAGSVIGTPAYMSPEQAGGMAVDPRSDIYSLGAIMYELFCGQPLFRGRSFGEYVRRHLTEAPVAPRDTMGGAQIDANLEALILRCLAKEPADRFGHILELRDGLLHLLAGPDGITPTPSELALALAGAGRILPLPAPALGMTTTVPTPPPVAMPVVLPAEPLVQGTGRWRWIAGGGIAIGLGVGAALIYLRARPDAPVPPASPTRVGMPSVLPAPPETPMLDLRRLELRFDSLPSAGVYAEGHAAELCRTPCAVNVDLTDGEVTDHRNFVVREEGYKDKTLTVDPSAPQREFHVTLERAVPGDAEASAERARHAGKAPRPAGRPDGKPDAKDASPVAPPPIDREVDRQIDREVDGKPAIEHDEASEKPARKTGPLIDPTDTHDPFKKRP